MTRHSALGGSLLALVAALGAAALLFLVTVPLDFQAQACVAGLIFGLLLLLRNFPRSGAVRVLVFVLAAFVSARYFGWRTTQTLVWHGPASYAATIALYLADVYGILVFVLGLFTNILPVRREPLPLAGEPESWPTVDILIPTYNESPELLEVTVIAATQVRYAPGRFKVWLCDDGGTAQRLTHADPALAAQARERQAALQRICERWGAHYLTREFNRNSKAGNLNEALPRTEGELVLILDADHIPTVDFLEQTVGFMQADPELFLVQTPHFFVNPDPFEKNHNLYGRIPSENEMFYQVIQPGLDFWNSAFFCGSAALLRRAHLMEVGGLSGMTITEDAETALTLHAKGYRSVFLNRPLISGLQPETYTSFVVQRVRWAQGMIQIFLLKNPLFQRGLKWYQKLNYFSTSFFWFFGFARMVTLLAPVAFLIFGLKIYETNLSTYCIYALPYVACSLVVTNYLFGRVRWTFISEVYELLQAFYTLPGIVQVLKNPHSPAFAVTPKGHTSDEDFVSELSAPFYWVYLITLAALAAGVARLVWLPAERPITAITMAWEVLNLLFLNAANGVMYERRQRRATPRIATRLDAELTLGDGAPIAVRVDNLSVTGGYVVGALEPGEAVRPNGPVSLRITDPLTGRTHALPGALANAQRLASGELGLGFRFTAETEEAKRGIVSLAHGDSARWKEVQADRDDYPRILRSFFFLLSLGLRHNPMQSRAFLRYAWQSVAGLFARGRAATALPAPAPAPLPEREGIS